MNLKENLGKSIQKYRKLNNLTQEKLAEIVEIEINSISSIERGRYFPSPENLEKIANVLKVKIKDLFDFEHQKDDIDLYSEIINRTKSVNRERLQDFYKIILSLTE